MTDTAEAARAREELLVAHRLFRRYEHRDTAWLVEFLLREWGGRCWAPTRRTRSAGWRASRRPGSRTAAHR